MAKTEKPKIPTPPSYIVCLVSVWRHWVWSRRSGVILRARIKFQSTEFPTTRTVKRNPKEAVNLFCYVLSKDDSDGQPNDSHNF